MAELKTKPTEVPVSDHVAAMEDDGRRADCEALVELMTRVTGCAPVIWGPSIVGFDRYHDRYASGHEGDACLADVQLPVLEALVVCSLVEVRRRYPRADA